MRFMVILLLGVGHAIGTIDGRKNIDSAIAEKHRTPKDNFSISEIIGEGEYGGSQGDRLTRRKGCVRGLSRRYLLPRKLEWPGGLMLMNKMTLRHDYFV